MLMTLQDYALIQQVALQDTLDSIQQESVLLLVRPLQICLEIRSLKHVFLYVRPPQSNTLQIMFQGLV